MRLRKDKSEKREQSRERKRRNGKGNRRVRGAVAALVLASIGAVGLVAFVKGAEERALAGEKLVDVLVVKERVDAGTPASELQDNLAVEEVPAKVRADEAVTDLAVITGLVAGVDLLPGEQITAARFVAPEDFTGRARAISVPEDLLEVTVSLAPERAVGGVIRPGSTVGVVASFDDGATGSGNAEEGEAPSPARGGGTSGIILHKVLVTNLQAPASAGFGGFGGGDEGESENAEAPTDDLLVTLALDAPSVERVVFAAEHGTLWLTLEPESAPEQGTRVQTRGVIYE